MKYITLLVPGYLVLFFIWELGKQYEAFVVDGELIATSIVLFFGLWILGYITGRKTNSQKD